MAASKTSKKTATASRSKTSSEGTKNDTSPSVVKSRQQLTKEHLPPLAFVFVVLICSGALMVLSMRDFLSTGRVIMGEVDANYLEFTKSTAWFENAKGWKSQQGGLSAISQVTTDKNNMGGFFVRKMMGAAGIAVHLQKIWPLIVHPTGAKWSYGHFRPLMWTALVSNAALVSFYAHYSKDLVYANAGPVAYGAITLLVVESLVMMALLWAGRKVKRGPAIAMQNGKTPNSRVCGIVTRTISLVTFLMTVVSVRDLFFPGTIIDVIPRDDIYLEWTGALLHSPPAHSPEAMDHGMEAPFLVGDKYCSQLMALHILILSLYKFVTAWGLRYGNDGRGEQQARMIWQGQTIGDGLMLFCVRLFTPAAMTASLDLRWHVMCLAYEFFILGLYGFF